MGTTQMQIVRLVGATDLNPLEVRTIPNPVLRIPHIIIASQLTGDVRPVIDQITNSTLRVTNPSATESCEVVLFVWFWHSLVGVAPDGYTTEVIYAGDLSAGGGEQVLTVIERLDTPPGAPLDGDRYLVIATAVGDWAGHEDEIAEWEATSASWVFTAPAEGDLIVVEAEQSVYIYHVGTGWELTTPLRHDLGTTARHTSIGQVAGEYVEADGVGGVRWRGMTEDTPNDTPVVYYVDGVTGDDAYDGLSDVVGGGHGPKKTINGALVLCPFIRHRDYFIKIADGTYPESLGLDGDGCTVALVGGWTVEQTGTVTAFNDVAITLNPCGFYQVDINWDGGFVPTDLVDDEKYLLFDLGGGVLHLVNLSTVLSAVRVEIRPYKYTGKVAGDYIGKPVSLVIPSVTISGAPGNGRPLSLIGGGHVHHPQAYTEYPGEFGRSSFMTFGLNLEMSDLLYGYTVLLEDFHGYFLPVFTRIKGTASGNSCVYILGGNFYFQPTATVHLYLTSDISATTLRQLSGNIYSTGSSNTQPGLGMVLHGCSLAVNGAFADARFYFTGVSKGIIDFCRSTLRMFSAGGVIYSAASYGIHLKTESVYDFQLSGLIMRKGGVHAHGCTLTNFSGFGVTEFRDLQNGPALQFHETTLKTLAGSASNTFTIGSSYNGPVIEILDASDIILRVKLTVTSCITSKAAITAILSRLRITGATTFPVQDYGVAPTQGIVNADKESHIIFEAAVTGQNTNVGASQPLVLRKGSKADVSQTAGYALQDNAGAETCYLGALGAAAVPAAGSTLNDLPIAPTGAEELCRISAV